MTWELAEAVAYYRRQGAPGDQGALIALLKEIQKERCGISQQDLKAVCDAYSIKEGLVLALIKRIPSLRLLQGHTLELCGGPNCGKAARLAAAAEKIARERSDITLKFVPCMRLCGKGPNLRYDGQLHHRADPELLKTLTQKE